MKNWVRYLIGGAVGMLGEYLYRVEFNVFPLTILSLCLIVIAVDLIHNRNK